MFQWTKSKEQAAKRQRWTRMLIFRELLKLFCKTRWKDLKSEIFDLHQPTVGRDYLHSLYVSIFLMFSFLRWNRKNRRTVRYICKSQFMFWLIITLVFLNTIIQVAIIKNCFSPMQKVKESISRQLSIITSLSGWTTSRSTPTSSSSPSSPWRCWWKCMQCHSRWDNLCILCPTKQDILSLAGLHGLPLQ